MIMQNTSRVEAVANALRSRATLEISGIVPSSRLYVANATTGEQYFNSVVQEPKQVVKVPPGEQLSIRVRNTNYLSYEISADINQHIELNVHQIEEDFY
jgi:hypothetical protein